MECNDPVAEVNKYKVGETAVPLCSDACFRKANPRRCLECQTVYTGQPRFSHQVCSGRCYDRYLSKPRAPGVSLAGEGGFLLGTPHKDGPRKCLGCETFPGQSEFNYQACSRWCYDQYMRKCRVLEEAGISLHTDPPPVVNTTFKTQESFGGGTHFGGPISGHAFGGYAVPLRSEQPGMFGHGGFFGAPPVNAFGQQGGGFGQSNFGPARLGHGAALIQRVVALEEKLGLAGGGLTWEQRLKRMEEAVEGMKL